MSRHAQLFVSSTNFSNTVGKRISLFDDLLLTDTEDARSNPKRAIFDPMTPSKTVADTNEAELPFGVIEYPQSQQMEVSQQTNLTKSSIDAVIGQISDETVLVRCFLPDGTLDMNIPPVLFDKELLVYGTPIRISIDKTGAFRRPVIQRRVISEQKPFADDKAISDWINSL